MSLELGTEELAVAVARSSDLTAKINQALIQIFQHVLCVAAGNVVVNIWVLLLQALCNSGKQTNIVGLSSTDHHIAHDGLIGMGNFFLCLLNQGEDFLRPAAQNHALVCEHNPPGTLGSTDQQLFPQFFLHGFHLGGQSRAGRCAGDSAAAEMLCSRATVRK